MFSVTLRLNSIRILFVSNSIDFRYRFENRRLYFIVSVHFIVQIDMTKLIDASNRVIQVVHFQLTVGE